MALHEFGLYVHIPFCLSRCGYCSFVSNIYDCELADTYLEALENEFTSRYASSPFHPTTIFIGGGTPTSFSVTQLERLFSFLPVCGAVEISCEINPDTITKEKLILLKECGVNRCSFGVQTFSDEGLRLLNRRHTAEAAIKAVKLAQQVGFQSLNIDLINGWPKQTESQLCADIAVAGELEIQHISYYNLIIEDAAAWSQKLRSDLAGPEEEEERGRRFWEILEDRLTEQGFIHYETSNFAQPGHHCRHNVAIWKGGDYQGIGLAAHSHRYGRRFANTSDMEQYLRCSAAPQEIEIFSEQLEPVAKAKETAIFWLRLFEGINLREFKEKTGRNMTELYSKELPFLMKHGALEFDETNNYIRVPQKQQPILDAIIEYLL